VYGPGEPSHRFAFQLISSFSRNMPFLVNNSNNERNYVYVLDLAKYIFKVLETDILRSEKEIYLAGKETFTIKEYSENLKVAWETKTGDTADVQYMSSISTNNLSLMEYDSQFISSIPNTSLSVASEKFVNWFIAGTPNLIVDYL
jgi:nucleoside-diphosphate-sugar epimerase